jgi:hypothetical protein
MEGKFKVGEEVVCIKATDNWYRLGEVYTIKEYLGHIEDHEFNEIYPAYVVEGCDFSIRAMWIDERDFELVGEQEGITEVIEQSSVSALDKQISGDHYKSCGIQPIEYIHANGLDYFEGNAVKYITRHRKKNGKADLEKAIHYLELLIEMEYTDK